MRERSVARMAAPPHSIEAEQAVLGSLLLDEKAWPQVAARLTAQDFYRPEHRLIFTAVAALAAQGSACDPVTAADYLQRTGRLSDTGGLAYLGSLARDTPTSANVVTYADVVRERSKRRALVRLAKSIERDVEGTGDRTAAELMAHYQAALSDLQNGSRVGKGLVSSRELAAELVDDLDRRREASCGLSMGLHDFDTLTAGLEPGDLVVIAARPGMGKTALLVTIAAHVSSNAGVGVFSAEMPAQQLMRRALSLGASIPQGRLRHAEQLTNSDWAAITPAIGSLAERRLWIDDSSQPTLAHIRAESSRQR